MADPKGPETGQDAKGAPSARPRSPTLDLSATDVTPKAAPQPGKPGDAPNDKPAAAATPQGSAKPAAASSDAAGVKSATAGAAGPTAEPGKPQADPVKAAAAGPTPTQPDAPKADGPGPEAPKAGAPKSEAPKSEALGAGSANPNPPKPDQPRPAAETGRPSAAVQPDAPVRAGVGVVGVTFAALAGAALALAGVALFGKELIGVPQPDLSRVLAVENKLTSVGGDIAALRADIARLKPADVAPIEARLGDLSRSSEAAAGQVAALDRSVKALSEQVAKPAVQDPAISVLSGRVDGLELRFQNAPSPEELAVLVGRLDGVEARMKDLPTKQALADLSGRVDGVGQTIGAATAPISSRVDEIAETLKAQPKGDPGARVVVALGALSQALEEGRPFAPELDAVKVASGATAELAALDPYAGKGLPTREALGAELAADIAQLPALKPPPSGSILDRFVASAGSVVKVTPQDAAAGSDPAAVRARVAALGSSGDLEGALAARGGLDEAARAATEDWAARASARVSAEKAIGSARTAALARLTSND